MEVCLKLWSSWEADAVVMDRERGVFADPDKVHRVEHRGRFFASRGPLTVVRSPQNGPAIIQAGVSPAGRDFAARYAEAVFAIQPSIEMAAAYHADLKARVAAAGRDPDACKILFGVQPIVGATEAEARERQAEHNALVPLEGGLAILSGHLDFDCSRLPLDAKMAEIPEPKLQRMQRVYRTLEGELLTVREVAQRHGQSVGLPQVVGTPESVADQLEAYWRRVGGDGFMLSPIHCPGAIEEFVDLVVPVLQRRGLFRTDYRGVTQREHLMQDSG
jgi:FMN-dependent oxidoreductase (nitrilotriacetate monooxygenase family)